MHIRKGAHSLSLVLGVLALNTYMGMKNSEANVGQPISNRLLLSHAYGNMGRNERQGLDDEGRKRRNRMLYRILAIPLFI